MLHGRKRITTVLASVAAVAVIGVIPTSPATAKPKLDDVKTRVDKLYHQAEVAAERVHDHEIRLADLNRDLAALGADEKRQSERLAGVRDEVRDSVLRQYQGQGISTVGQVVVSDDPSAFLGQLTTMSAYNDLQDGLFADYTTEVEALDIRREATEQRRREIAATTRQLGAEKKAIDERLAEAKELLGKLEAEERAKLAGSTSFNADVPSNISASGRAKIAIDYAMAQVGDSYVFGAAGPNAWDCSGLMMVAWGQAGVGLPHSSRMQMGSGTPVSRDNLQPGDLLFYYSPVSHVGMYIGNGLIVHAANPSAGVRVSGAFSMPYAGAVRPG